MLYKDKMDHSAHEGIPKELFKNDNVIQITDFECIICLNICNIPKQCPNGHLFCANCIESALARKKQCPSCSITLNTENLGTCLLARNLINAFVVSCPVTGSGVRNRCPWSGKLSELPNHKEMCEYQSIKCTNAGCDANVIRKELNNHLSLCPCQLISCPLDQEGLCGEHCPKTLRRSEVDTHLQSPATVALMFQAVISTRKRCRELEEQVSDHPTKAVSAAGSAVGTVSAALEGMQPLQFCLTPEMSACAGGIEEGRMTTVVEKETWSNRSWASAIYIDPLVGDVSFFTVEVKSLIRFSPLFFGVIGDTKPSTKSISSSTSFGWNAYSDNDILLRYVKGQHSCETLLFTALKVGDKFVVKFDSIRRTLSMQLTGSQEVYSMAVDLEQAHFHIALYDPGAAVAVRRSTAEERTQFP